MSNARWICCLFAVGIGPGGAPAGRDLPGEAELASRVQALFAARCADCHGPSLRQPLGRFGYVLDLKRMAENPRLVKPFHPEASKL
jgi:mono/diheme cytochrome c family protein